MIELQNVHLGYGKKSVLRDVSCQIAAGDYVGIVGPNGSGKTTFLRGVLGQIQAKSGRMQVDRGQRFAYVPQSDELNPLWPITVRETVELPLRARRLFGRLTPEEGRLVERMLSQTGISGVANERISAVSGGQRQLAILAQALAQNPDALLLDEPTRGLDVVVEQEFLSIVQRIRKDSRLTVLFVTHTLQIPLNACDRILLFQDGRVHAATPDELVTCDRLDKIYGVPFLHQSVDGIRWAVPKGVLP